jgi:hypothetical protein
MPNPEMGPMPEQEKTDIAVAKETALKILDEGKPKEAIASMLNDLGRSRTYEILALAVLSDPGFNEDTAREFIEGFRE